MKIISLALTVVAVNFCFCSIAQPYGGPLGMSESLIPDGPVAIIPVNIPTKRMIPYEYVREADVLWSKRVWQYIDLREKINLPLYYPMDEITPYGTWRKNNQRYSLWTIIRMHVLEGDLRVFSPYDPLSFGLGVKDGDQFKYPIEPSSPGKNYYTDSLFRDELVWYLGYLGEPSDIPKVDEFGEPIIIEINGVPSYDYGPRDTIWYTSKDIVQYRLKEDWFFDKERSVLDVRIMGIAPVVYKYQVGPDGQRQVTGMKELFWLYFPQCRYILNNYFSYNSSNDVQWMSFDDLFWKRRFNAVIYKESNVYDRKIEDHAVGLDALYVDKELKNEIRNIEHDLWSF